jgi:hypothetical protein
MEAAARADKRLVTIFARRLPPRGLPRPRTFLSTLTIALCASLTLLCAPASAVVTEAEGSGKVGVQPREVHYFTDGAFKYDGEHGAVASNKAAADFENSAEGPVVHSARVYLIYWDPQYFYHDDWQNLIDEFAEHAGAVGGSLAKVFAVDAQYSDPTNTPAANDFSFLGAKDDANPYPEPSGCTDLNPFEETPPVADTPLVQGLAVCLTGSQIDAQLEAFISENDLPRGMSTVYYVLTPPGVSVCLEKSSERCSEFTGTPEEIEADEKAGETSKEQYKRYEKSFCSYHGAIGDGDEHTILYGVIPWSVGGAGDGQLPAKDELRGYPCQDGGFEPAKKSTDPELLEKERESKEKTPKEQEEFDNKDAEEKREVVEDEELKLNGPHQQEPNGGPSEDGFHDRGLADLIMNQIAVEQQNIVTDPLLDGWQDSEHKELTDECRNFFFPASGSPTVVPTTGAGQLFNQNFEGKDYYLNDAFDLAGLKLDFPGVPCWTGVALVPRFTPPNPASSGTALGFNGMESDISLNWADHFRKNGAPYAVYPVYTWNFGDGSPTVSGYAPASPSSSSSEAPPCPEPWLSPCAGSVFHTYQYGGTYTVTLTVTDVAGNTASVAHQVTVSGPLPPSKEESKSESSSSSSSSSSSNSSSSSSSSGQPTAANPSPPAPATVPAPKAAAAVASHKLSSTLKKGLVVRYSVNEQVAGHFEVLLSSAIARRLKIAGAPATGLPAGSAPEVVIAKAILVTTKGGNSTVDIQFSKSTAAHLARLHKVTLLLRLIVRNAAPHSPATASVLTPITLTG